MALRAKYEVSAHIHGFKNINLKHQGFYYVEVRFFTQTDDEKLYARPTKFETVKWEYKFPASKAKLVNKLNLDYSK